MASSCTSSSWDWKLQITSSSGLKKSSGRHNTRSRRRYIFNKSLTKPGMFLVLGVVMLAAFPLSAFCRPIDKGEAAENISKQFHVYEQSSEGSSIGGSLSSSSRLPRSSLGTNDEDVSAAAEEKSSRFEFQREILSSSSSNKPDADSNKNSHIRAKNNNVSNYEHSLEVIHNKNEDNVLLGGNSSMIVHVIVTSSSSSTSGGSLEFDETDSNSQQDSSSIPENTFQFTISDDDGSLVAEPSSDSHVSAVKSSSSSAATTTFAEHQDLKKNSNEENRSSHPPKKSPRLSQNFHIVVANDNEELELKKLPKSQNATPDIFSAFYRAFSETSPTSPSVKLESSSLSRIAPAQQDKTTHLPVLPTTDGTITTFKIPARSDFRQRPSSFQLFQQRRRLYRNRQPLDKSILFQTTPAPQKSFSDIDSKNVSILGSTSVEETARKLEFLAKKLDKTEHDHSFRGQQDKILMVSSSSSLSLITTTQVPFLLSQPFSPPVSSFSPSKIAVSVTHTKSVVASSVATTKNSEESAEPTQQEVVEGRVKNDAKSEATFSESQQEREKIHSTYSYFTRPRPLIKTFPRNKDQQNDNINNKNRSSSHIFPKNFSTHGREENGILGKTYRNGGDILESSNTSTNGNGYSDTAPFERRSNDNHKDTVNEDNFRIQDRLNIISPSREGGHSAYSSDLPNSSSFALPSTHFSGFIEVTTFRPSVPRRKITRTVSSEIGDPSSFFFNVNYTPKSPPKVSASRKAEEISQSTQKPIRNWQQPEKIWSEPAQVWGVPSKVWGEPERVWSQPAQIWNQPENIWAKKLDDEMMQSDQPPEERKAEDEEISPQGTFVILGDDENEGDSIDGDLGRPLMLHHFTVPTNKQKETVSVSTRVTSSVSSNNKTIHNGNSNTETGQFSRNTNSAGYSLGAHQQSGVTSSTHTSPTGGRSAGVTSSRAVPNNGDTNTDSESDGDQQAQNKKSGKKFGYVIEGANVRKYRVEERTPDGYIVGEYGVLNNQNAFLRGVRYTADGTINPRLIHEALMKFLSLRR